MSTPTIEQRVTGLEELVKPLVPLPGRVKDLETYAGPGQNEAFTEGFKEVRAGIKELRADFKKFGRVQAGHTSMLERQSTKLQDIQKDMYAFATDMTVLKSDMRDFKQQVSERLEQVDNDMVELKTDMVELKTEMVELKTDMVEVKGALAEILERLPAKGA